MKTFKFKLYSSKKNKTIHHHINIGGIVYNHVIAIHKRYYKYFKKYPSKFDIQKHITKLKKQKKHEFWNQLGSQAIQVIVERIDFGYKKFFKKQNKRPPNFRKVKKAKSFTLKQAGWEILEDNRVRIGKNFYKYFKSREVEGNVKTVTVKRDPLGDIYLYFVTDFEEKPKEKIESGKTAGFDFGLKTFLTGSDGTVIESPLFFKSGMKQIRKANRNLSSKEKDSNNREKARKNLARKHKKVANRRLDFHFKLARNLVLFYDFIFLETLNLNGMKKLWGRKVSDLGFGNFVRILHSQSWQTGRAVHHISPWFPSSKMCSNCGWIYQDLSLSEREWTCPICGKVHQRDFNSSTNIEREGASSLELGDVRRGLSPHSLLDLRIPRPLGVGSMSKVRRSFTELQRHFVFQ